jgi:small Trp-rich protein
MWLLVFAVIVLVLKLLGIPHQIEGLSWWWITGAFGAAFVWFEFIERWLGLDKRKAFDEIERLRQERLKRSSQPQPPSARR